MKDVPLLQLQHIHYHACGPIDLSVAAGECVVIQGPSGAGKSLLLQVIADLIPHEGMLHLKGIASTAYSPQQWRQQVGLLFANSQWWAPTIAQHFTHLPKEEAVILGLQEDLFNQSPQTLSTGQLQRLALLRLLAQKPQVLLLDEPTAHLDPAHVKKMETMIQQYQQREGAAVIWVSHDAEQVTRIAQRVLHIAGGQLHNGGH